MADGRSHAAALGDPMATHWWVFSIRGTLAVAFGLAVLLLPGLGRLILLHMLAFQLLVGGALILVALRRMPWGCGWRPDPFRAEAMLGIAVGVVLGDFAVELKAILLPAIAAWAAADGVLSLAGATRLGAHRGCAWSVLRGLVSLTAGGLLGAAFAVLTLYPHGEALLLGAGAVTYGPLAAALTAWFPAFAIPSGTAHLALSLRLFLGAPRMPISARIKELAAASGAVGLVSASLVFSPVGLAGGALFALGLLPAVRVASHGGGIRGAVAISPSDSCERCNSAHATAP